MSKKKQQVKKVDLDDLKKEVKMVGNLIYTKSFIIINF